MPPREARSDIPTYDELMQPLLQALVALGGSAKPAEVYEFLAKELHLSDTALEQTKKDGTSLFHNRVAWARSYLAKTGYIDSSKRGVWSLTEKSHGTKIDERAVRAIVAEVKRLDSLRRLPTLSEPEPDPEDEPDSQTTDYRQEVLAILYAMSPKGFERLCQRLLRESGFEQVVVTGRSGDGGIDGHGVLQLNPFVSFRVLFQCKRYKGSVGAPVIRDFRGAIVGRADKGIVLTTGSFTQDARREATRDGVAPIELVDGNDLVGLFETLEFGLRPKQTFEVDREFFREYEN